MRIVYWENIISQHKLPYFEYLAKSKEVGEFVLVVEEELSQQLKEQGWHSKVPKLSNFSLVVNPSNKTINEILLENQSNSFHVFSGIRSIPMVFSAFQESLNLNVNRILLTESVNTLGLRAISRRLASFFIERKFLKNYDLVLGSGASTQKWYVECGLEIKNFYPFLYAVQDTETKIIKNLDNELLKLVFVGRVEKAKGLDVLLEALKSSDKGKFKLDIYGDLVEDVFFKKLVNDLNLNNNVEFKGVKSNLELRNLLQQYHMLVLPSRWDGWGAVINEAIASGLKVICSDRCGASILIINDKIGHVFNVNKSQSLTNIIEQTITDKNTIDRDYILEYSNYLKGDKVAQYLIDIINFHYKNKGSRPLPPWEKFQLEKNINTQNSVN
ncbi:glycosyltransferase [Psychroserpens sp. AS72]|uniref:glycosyltransferase n=1 Tax=Psychroserpens sp. AS72 TaxID=3135775 RepID=UPI003172DE4D